MGDEVECEGELLRGGERPDVEVGRGGTVQGYVVRVEFAGYGDVAFCVEALDEFSSLGCDGRIVRRSRLLREEVCSGRLRLWSTGWSRWRGETWRGPVHRETADR